MSDIKSDLKEKKFSPLNALIGFLILLLFIFFSGILTKLTKKIFELGYNLIF